MVVDIKVYGWCMLVDILGSFLGLYINYDCNYIMLGVCGFLCVGDYDMCFLLFIDGYCINDFIFDQVVVGFEVIFNVDLIEWVEYVFGVGLVVYGLNVLFGVINIIIK